MSNTKILRRKELEFRLSLSCSTIYSMMAAGKFPRPIRLGKRAVGWREDVVEQWISDRSSGAHLFKRD